MFSHTFIRRSSAEPIAAVVHDSCRVKTIAGEISAAVLESLQSGEESDRIYARGAEPGDLRAIFVRLAADYLRSNSRGG